MLLIKGCYYKHIGALFLKKAFLIIKKTFFPYAEQLFEL